MRLATFDQLTTVVSTATRLPGSGNRKGFENSNLYFHLVLRTDGAGFDFPRRKRLEKYIACFVRATGGEIVEMSFAPDRFHLLVGLSAFRALGSFVRELKLLSKTFARQKLETRDFAWREQHEAFTVGLTQIERVRSYIRRQTSLEMQESYAASWQRIPSREMV